MPDSHHLCHHCGKPIREGQHRWTRREPEEHWHYDCATKAGLTLAYNPFMGGQTRPKPAGDKR